MDDVIQSIHPWTLWDLLQDQIPNGNKIRPERYTIHLEPGKSYVAAEGEAWDPKTGTVLLKEGCRLTEKISAVQTAALFEQLVETFELPERTKSVTVSTDREFKHQLNIKLSVAAYVKVGASKKGGMTGLKRDMEEEVPAPKRGGRTGVERTVDSN